MTAFRIALAYVVFLLPTAASSEEGRVEFYEESIEVEEVIEEIIIETPDGISAATLNATPLLHSEELQQMQKREMEKRRYQNEIARLRERYELEEQKHGLELLLRRHVRELKELSPADNYSARVSQTSAPEFYETPPFPQVYLIAGTDKHLKAELAYPGELPTKITAGDELNTPDGIYRVSHISSKGVKITHTQHSRSYFLPVAGQPVRATQAIAENGAVTISTPSLVHISDTQ